MCACVFDCVWFLSVRRIKLRTAVVSVIHSPRDVGVASTDTQTLVVEKSLS